MRPGLFIALFYALLVVSAFGVCYGRALDASRQPLLGTWRGDFRVDLLRTSADALEEAKSVPARLTITFSSETAPEWWPVSFWQRAFSGRYAPARGPRFEGHDSAHALAVRDFRDSVWFALGVPCCDAGGVIGHGTVHGDTLTGRWYIDSDARRVFGRFQLVRQSAPPPRAQN